MWHDALTRSSEESAAWPYDWVRSPDYPLTSGRATVMGHVVLNDPLGARSSGRGTAFSHLLVGLAAPSYTVPGRNGPQTIDRQVDAKHYQFWTRAKDDGTFSIPNVRPGTYTLHAIADSVLGEYAQADVTMEAGQRLDLGTVEWKPVRHGRQLWDIGIPDRTAGEFLHGDRPWQWGLYLQYPKDFPHDVHYAVGASDYHKDWNIMQVPRAPADDTVGRSKGTATPWVISFNLPSSPKGTATLRLALAGTEARSLDVAVNGQHVAALTGFPNTSSIHRDSNTSYWQERDVPFPGSLLRRGENTLTLTVPAGSVTAGVMYDYLRLELDESASPPAESR